MSKILIKPVLTEKMDAQKEKLNRFGFIVDKQANKIEIAKAVEKLYEVTVLNVNTMIYASKKSTKYTKKGIVSGKRNAYKKAIVTLIEGDTIDFYSSI